MRTVRLMVEAGVPERGAVLAAASRLHGVEVVDGVEEADGVVRSESGASTGLPVLVLGALAADPGARLFPALSERFDPHVESVRRRLEAGDLGRPGLVRLHVWSPEDEALGRLQRIEAIDLVLWLTGGTVERSYCTRSAQSQVMHLGFANGAMAVVDFCDGLPAGDGYRSLTVIGSDGAAYADDHRDRSLFFAGGAPGARPPATAQSRLCPMLENFVDRVHAGADAAADQNAYRAAEALVNQLP